MSAFPTDPEFQSVKFSSRFYNVESEAISGRKQSRHLGGQRFEFAAKYNNLTSAEFLPVFAFVNALKNSVTTFTIVLPVLSSISGDASGTVTVNGAHSIGDSTILIAGLTGTLKAGNFVKFNSGTKVYMITADLTGAGTLSIMPPLVDSLTTLEAVTYDDVPFTATMRNKVQTFSASGFDTYGYEVNMVEAV